MRKVKRMKKQFAWSLGAAALVASLALPVQAQAAPVSDGVYGRTYQVELSGDTEETLDGLKGAYQGGIKLTRTDTAAKGYKELPGSKLVGSVQASGDAQNFKLSAFPIPDELSAYSGKVLAMYAEYADGTTDVSRLVISADPVKDPAWFACDKMAVRYTFAIEPFMDSANILYHADDVVWLAETGISKGFPNGEFRPVETVKRADMAAFLRRTAVQLGVEGADTWKPAEADWAAFKDVDKDTPHAEDILWLAQSGLSEGFPGKQFRPMAEVARCDMAAFLRRLAALAGSEDAKTWAPADLDWQKFTDVDGDTPHVNDVLWLAHAQVSEGFGDKSFQAYRSIARCDMAAFLHRLDTAVKGAGTDVETPGTDTETPAE